LEVQNYAKIDILVANAGIAGPNYKSWDIDASKQVIDVNLNGFIFYLSCRSPIHD